MDLEAGSEFGYKLLFVVLLAGLMAVVFQVRLDLPSLKIAILTTTDVIYRLWQADLDA